MVALNAELVDLEQKNKYLEDELSATNVQARPFMQFNVWCVFVRACCFLRLYTTPIRYPIRTACLAAGEDAARPRIPTERAEDVVAVWLNRLRQSSQGARNARMRV